MSSGFYLDHAATSFPKAPGVVEAVSQFLHEAAGNPGRGGHTLSCAASRAIEAAREDVAALLGLSPERLFFGSTATYWLNTLLSSQLRSGDRVVTSAMEHNAVMRPLRFFERSRSIVVRVVRGDAEGGVPRPEEIRAAIDEAPTRLVVLNHASNITGNVVPIREIAALTGDVPVIVDGAQTAGALPLNFEELGVAALACSGHKSLLGPPGVGLLLLAPGFEVEPLVRGGTGSRSESEEMPEFLPDRLEAGTPNGAGIVGLGAAVRWLAAEGVEEVHRRTTRHIERLAEGLARLPGVHLPGYTASSEQVGILSFVCSGIDHGVLAAWLDKEFGVMMRAGLHCAPAAHRRIGTFPEGTLRIGVGPFTSGPQIDVLLEGVARAIEDLR